MNNLKPRKKPGPIALFGSGEISPSGQKIFDAVLSKLGRDPLISILETPAGFELNSPEVAQKVADFLEHHLQNYHPQIELIPARTRAGRHSTNNPDILDPLLSSRLIFMGPGSPSYAVRMLEESLAWKYLQAAHRTGAGLAFSSAATIALGSSALPVYEIFKVGQDLHWINGLNLLNPYGLDLALIPHWNNKEGGKELDTSRCYMGLKRFRPLKDLLPGSTKILGIDEHTGVIIDFGDESCQVVGNGNAYILSGEQQTRFTAGTEFDIHHLGPFVNPAVVPGVNPALVERARKTRSDVTPEPDPEIIKLAEKRQALREVRNWKEADQIRERIEQAGWLIKDTDGSFRLIPRE